MLGWRWWESHGGNEVPVLLGLVVNVSQSQR